MLAVNRVMAAGNLVRDPEIRATSGGATVGTFTLALNERFQRRDGTEKEEVAFVDVEVWGRQAKACGDCLHKGSAAFVEGRLKLNRWEDRETGKPRSRLYIRGDRVQFMSQPGQRSTGAPRRQENDWAEPVHSRRDAATAGR